MIRFEDTDSQPLPDPQDTPIKEWRSMFEAGTFSSADIVKYIQDQAPHYFELHNYIDAADRCSYNENAAKVGIIDAIMEFILGDDPETVLEKLKLEGNTPAVCGKVFKHGEPTYSCRECGMDPTCVLCVNCFKQSAHRYHRYKMSTSGGGGCCDCGDEEAWKKDQYCEEHSRGKQQNAESTIITPGMKERCEMTFRAILMYSIKFLEIESQASLDCLDADDDEDALFCTVLYNDESHTFEQVIQTLTKIVKCVQSEAHEMVTSIDREGRAVVKCDTFEACIQLKDAVEKQPLQYGNNASKLQPLKVSVLHKRAVSCQQFAIQLLTWFQEFLTQHSTFRMIFAAVANDKRNRAYSIGHILEYDWKLWKTARSCWHRLLISGMLMEYDNKKLLAIEFSKHYSTVIQDFIRDDHDHSVSIVSLSVQLFTVPTIAHYLIANEGIFHKLLHTFYCESIEKYVQNKTLHFAKNLANMNIFKRAAYILYDMKYILSFKPDVWTDELREGFLEGCKVLLKLLNVMQGMESIQRQTGQHMDYEPEWESAFNLHIKLAAVITSVLEWCSSDREILIKVYQMIMKHINENGFILARTTVEEQKVAGHVARCLMYDVSSRAVSIHLPLSRFFAGIYLHLGEHGLNFDNVTTVAKRSPEEIMEPILCTQVMVAQVHSGMWRRNGYSLLHQLFFYRNVRCRAEMLDRDIAGLQIGAALIESNQYLIHLLNKFNLLDWVQPEYEPSNRNPTDDDFIRQINMVDEFLELLIVIIGERYEPGIAHVTEEDRTKKEIIQQLCIKNFSHSELNRALPDTNSKTLLEDVIDSIAVFKKPSRTDTKGVYELKEEFYDEYNMYFYHYTKEEKSKSEETQRRRRRAKEQLVCCPPPKLPKLTDGFVSIANLLQCDVMLSIMHTILSRALDLKARSFTENHLQKILHLIGYGLQEEESQNYPFLSFYERAMQLDMLPLLEKLSHSARVEAHRDFIIWMIKKFKDLQPKEVKDEAMESEETAQPITVAEAEKIEKEERAKIAAERRAQLLAQMANAQNNFMKSNAALFAATSTEPAAGEAMELEESRPEEDEGAAAVVSSSYACIGFNRRLPQPEEHKYKCILCFEDCVVSRDGNCVVYSAFVQKSKVVVDSQLGCRITNPIPDDTFITAPHTGSCGHVMHAHCWREYFDNEILKENRRPNRRPANNFITEKMEFLCPYCRCLSNAVMPLTAALSHYAPPTIFQSEEDVIPYDKWRAILHSYLTAWHEIEDNTDFSPEVAATQKFPDMKQILEEHHVSEEDFKKICLPVEKSDVTPEWLTCTQAFLASVQRVAPYPHAAELCENFLIAWNSCTYTVMSVEMYLRAIDKPLTNELSIRHTSCLRGLVRMAGMLGTSISKEVNWMLMIHVRGMLESMLEHKGPSVVEVNVFQMMSTSLFCVMASIYSCYQQHVVPSGNHFEFYFLQMMYTANLAKAVVIFDQDQDNVYMDMDEEPSALTPEEVSIYDKVIDVYKRANLSWRDQRTRTEPTHADMRRLFQFIKQNMRQYLRCSTLLFHFLTDVDFPEELNDMFADEYETMCKYLGLEPVLERYFDASGPHLAVLEHFVSHPDIRDYNPNLGAKPNNESFSIVPCVTPLKKLVTLPDDYSDLINNVSDFSCPNNQREEMKTPTMCLVCGAVLCGQSYCCQPLLDKSNVGACTYHAHKCGAGIGVFLRIRDCQVMFLGVNKGCFVPAPYLDEYGETDPLLRRGNPLRLCAEKYRKLYLTWLGHGLHEEIARLIDGAGSSMPTQWHHM